MVYPVIGTKTTKPGEFSKIIAAAGGRENAFTGADYTCYFQQLEKSQLPISLKMEADRMQNLIVSEEEFAKEIKVVMEENSPGLVVLVPLNIMCSKR